MSGRSSPVNGGYESARLTVRKDLFPNLRLSKLTPGASPSPDYEESISCVKLETDFEKSIDEIAIQKQQLIANGMMSSPSRSRHKKHKSKRDSERSTVNGYILSESKRKKRSRHRTHTNNTEVPQVISGKNLNLVSSSECRGVNDEDEEEEVEPEPEVAVEAEEVAQSSSDDEVLKYSVKLPLINKPRQSGKPYSHELSQLSTKKKKRGKERRSHVIIPCSGKPRSMMDIRSRKKKSKKSESVPIPEPVPAPVPVSTYRSQIVDTHTMKIKIKRTSVRETLQVAPPPPTLSISDLGQRKSKKKRAASPVASESSGEEYDPTKGDPSAAMSVAAPKSKHARPKTKKSNNNKSNNNKSNNSKSSNSKSSNSKSSNAKSKDKSEKTERNRISAAESKDKGPQSPWGSSMPSEILLKIFENVVASQGSLPSVIRLGRVCKQWHSVSCRPELWKHVDLAQYTTEKCKTDYKLVWLLENRLSQCLSLNIAQWKVCNVSWVLACVADYCPSLVELSVAGWSRITPDQLFDLMQGLPLLQRLDLSLTSETGGSSTCLSATSMGRLAEQHGARLTHLTLANNKFTALPQILASVAAHCQNLEVLDISGALATSHPAAIPLEALQKGCPKMRVFRAANSQLVLASATTSQQMEAGGWSQLEELSIAGEAASELIGEYKLGDDALSRLVRGATRLRLLDLRGLQRLTDSGLVRVPAWDLQHLFLGGCNVTRQSNACLELICEKWSHSLLELDLSWASAARVLDTAVAALADEPRSRLRTLNLCGSSVSLEPVKKVLLKCKNIESINLSSCRALPRGMKRLYTGKELQDLKDSLDPEKVKAKEEAKETNEKTRKGKDSKKTEADSKSDAKESSSSNLEQSDSKVESKVHDESSSFLIPEPKSTATLGPNEKSTSASETLVKTSPDSKSSDLSTSKDESSNSTPEGKRSTRDATPKLLSPHPQSRPDSSSTPRSDPAKSDHGSPHFSPVPKPDSQVQNSPDVQPETVKSNSWNMGHYKTTPTHKSEASPLNRLDSSKLKLGKMIEQCSPTTSVENKRSPEAIKQDIKNPNNWSYENYSPMPRQDGQFSSQRSPYSAQPSPAQPSPYSTQPSPYSAQPSPYSSQPSPYSAQPSPDTSQIVKPELPKSGAWNSGNYSPMPKHHQPFSPHPSTHTSPDAGVGMKADVIRSTPNRTPGQYSPMSRQDRIHQSPYSPRPSVDNVAYSNKKSPGMGNFSPMMRPDCHLPSPDPGVASRPALSGRSQEIFARTVSKSSDVVQNPTALPEIGNQWGVDRFNQICNAVSSNIDTMGWGVPPFGAEPSPQADAMPAMLNTPPPQPQWTGLPPFGNSARRPNDDISDPWTIGQYREEPPHQVHNTFVEQNISFESLRTHLGHQSHNLTSYLEDAFTETSRVD